MWNRCVLRWSRLLVAVLMLAAFGSAHAADGEKRVALVIGIGKYEHAEELVNPRNDARAIAAAFRKFDFDVVEHYDLDMRGLQSALRDFGVRAGEADVAVIYYAGHGIQVSGTNYLIPADAQLQRERDLLYEGLPIRLPLGELTQARRLGVLILDACRNNPFLENLTRSGLRREQVRWGFAAIDDTPGDTLVALATRSDQLAEDGAGEHSPYAAAILRSLEVPGLELGLFFRQVRDDVIRATNGRQEPYIYGSLGAGPFYFNPRPPNRPPVLGDLRPLDVLDNAWAEPLHIPPPTDPDGDRLFARVTGLPRGGSVRIGERSVLIGDYLTMVQLAAASFRPSGEFRGDAGSFEFMVSDERDGVVRGVVPITITPSNRAPAVAAGRTARFTAALLPIDAPSDPDGDPLTVTVTGVPETGTVKSGKAAVHVGDTLTVAELTGLAFDPGHAGPGPAGTFSYIVEDGKGGRADGNVALEIADAGAAPAGNADEAVWQRIHASSDAQDFEAFLRLFGDSSHAAQARQRLGGLAVARIGEALWTPGLPASGSSAAAPPAGTGIAAPPSGSGGGPAEPAAPSGRYVAMSDANVRDEPSTHGDRIALLPRGSGVQVLGRVPGVDWVRVALDDGHQGFVYAPLLSRVAPAEPQAPAVVQAERPPEPPVQVAAADAQQLAALAAPSGPARSHAAGNAFRDCPDCPLIVRLPPGEFLMGNDHGDSSERPVHRVTVAKPFAMGVHPVTVAEWRACVVGGGCPDMPRMTRATDDTPIHNVHWQDAQAYVTWLTRKTGQRYRLPTEAEWEYAARAGTSGPYWWAGQTGIFAGCANCGGPHAQLTPAAVGSYRPNPFGLHDMNGSVAQWVADCWNKDYRGAPSDGGAWEQGTCGKRVLRGGSWRNTLAEITSTARNSYDVDVRYINHGFRVARDVR